MVSVKIFLSILTIVLCVIVETFAQTDPMFLQQTNNRAVINPAAAGKGGDINAYLAVRRQWTGFPGPSTQVVNGSGFVKDIRSGFGLMWMSDKFGPQKTQNLKMNYAYFIPFEEKAFLSLGLGMGLFSSTYDESDFFARESDDESITFIKESKIMPDFDFGFEFNTRQIEIGASVTHLLRSHEDQSLVVPMRNIYVYARGKLPMDKYWDFIPGITWHNTQKLNTYELSMGFRYNNNICVNLIYRNPMTLGVALGINVYRGIRVAYSFDYGIDELSSYNNGSHEIMLSYNIPVNTTYVKSKLRFFKWKMF